LGFHFWEDLKAPFFKEERGILNLAYGTQREIGNKTSLTFF
jgi:hypothetical protein